VEVLDRLLDPLRVDGIRPEPLRQPGVEAVKRLVRDLPPEPRVDLAVDPPRLDDPLEQPDRRAVAEQLELGDREAGRLLQAASSVMPSIR